MDIKLSVLVTTYNLEKYIDETLESVMNQRVNFNLEVLIGDDGSKDDTLSILYKWEKKYPGIIKVFTMERKEGIFYDRIERASRNRINLMKHMHGKYVIFLDGDDFYTDRDKLQKQVDILESKCNQDCIACAHNSNFYWSETKVKPINRYNRVFKIEGKTYWKYGIYFLSEAFMFRNVFDDAFYRNINNAYFDDNRIVFSVLKYGKIIYIPDNMVNYRQLENSSWNAMNTEEKKLINLMSLDIENQINADFGRESNIRHFSHKLYFWKNRNRISDGIRKKYYDQICNYELNKTAQWISWEQLSCAKQISMTAELLVNAISFLWTKMQKKIWEFVVLRVAR